MKDRGEGFKPGFDPFLGARVERFDFEDAVARAHSIAGLEQCFTLRLHASLRLLTTP